MTLQFRLLKHLSGATRPLALARRVAGDDNADHVDDFDDHGDDQGDGNGDDHIDNCVDDGDDHVDDQPKTSFGGWTRQ